MTIRTLICDGDVLTRRAVESILLSDPEFEIVATATAVEVIERAVTSRPQLALIGSNVEGGHGLDLIRWFSTNLPCCRSVLMGARLIDEEVVACHEAGGIPMLTAGRTVDDVLDAVRQAAIGRIDDPDLVSAARQRLEGDDERPFAELNYTDRRILQLVARGFTNIQIARTLHYSTYTVRNRISRLLRILGVDNRTQLALLAQHRFSLRA